MRIAQAVRPDLLAGAVHRREGVVVRDAVAAVLAYGARGGVLAQIGDDAENLPHEGVESLRVPAATVALLAGAGVTGAEVHDAPVGIAGTRGRVECHLAERMNRRGLLQPQQLARGSLEGAVRWIAILPFDEHRLARDLSVHGRRGDRRRCRVTGEVQTGDDAALR